MSEKTIHTEPEINQIVICSSCGQQNRLYPRVNQGIYRCGNCHNQIPDPFVCLVPRAQSAISRKVVGLMILAGVLLAGAGLLNFARGILSTGSQSPRVAAIPIAATPITATLARASLQPVVSSPSPPLQNRSLPTSKVLVPLAISGDGTLKVSNGTNRDAHVKLVDPATRKLVTSFYVKSSSDFTVEQISDGTYEVLFATGEDWDTKTRSFIRSSFTKFDKSLNFVTKRLADGVQYTIIQLTLNPVTNGNVTLSRVDEQEFSQY